ncbi:MAG: hypothetical protein CL878_09465 [Dehalococcoidia bacterium]|nr:hypothetical protein [Dehalococcoidia bacterium]
MSAAWQTGRFYLVVFIASACTLVLEIVAGRLLAPHLGVSLYTWTSIIGVVLAGISVGNYLGGRLADRFPTPSTLGLCLLGGSLTSFATLAAVTSLHETTFDLAPLPRILLMTAGLFFLPSCVLGMVTPLVVKQALTSLARTGSIVGQLYAISTAGSIVGVYLAGFVLIGRFGTRTVVFMVAIVLLLLALLFGHLHRARWLGAALLVGTLALAGNAARPTVRSDNCTLETNYFCIRVTDVVRLDQPVKRLQLDQLVHSFNSLTDPQLLVYGYVQIAAEAAQYVAEREPRFRTLFLGGGGYTLPRALEARYPGASAEVIEIDEVVTQVAHTHMGLDRDTRVVTYNEDARMAVRGLPTHSYHLIFGDTFNDFSVPYHLTTLEFSHQIRDLLVEDGIYVTNIVDKLIDGRFLKAFVRTLQQVFPYVYVLGESDGIILADVPQRGTFVVAAAAQPIEFEQFGAYPDPGAAAATTRVMDQSAMRAWLDTGPSEILTDDHVPVDTMLAPLFLER